MVRARPKDCGTSVRGFRKRKPAFSLLQKACDGEQDNVGKLFEDCVAHFFSCSLCSARRLIIQWHLEHSRANCGAWPLRVRVPDVVVTMMKSGTKRAEFQELWCDRSRRE